MMNTPLLNCDIKKLMNRNIEHTGVENRKQIFLIKKKMNEYIGLLMNTNTFALGFKHKLLSLCEVKSTMN